MSVSIMWFRRDFRLTDHPALQSAVAAGPDGVVPVVVVDEASTGPPASVSRACLAGHVKALGRRIGGVHVVHGDPAMEIPRVAASIGAATVHVTTDFTPDGKQRDVSSASIHAPWLMPDPPPQYPPPLVVHADERREALRRFGAMRQRNP